MNQFEEHKELRLKKMSRASRCEGPHQVYQYIYIYRPEGEGREEGIEFFFWKIMANFPTWWKKINPNIQKIQQGEGRINERNL